MWLPNEYNFANFALNLRNLNQNQQTYVIRICSSTHYFKQFSYNNAVDRRECPTVYTVLYIIIKFIKNKRYMFAVLHLPSLSKCKEICHIVYQYTYLYHLSQLCDYQSKHKVLLSGECARTVDRCVWFESRLRLDFLPPAT